MKLTHKNYHSAKNKCLTTSKLKDFLIDERYFFDKHVLGIVEFEGSDAMTLGSMVDEALMFGVAKMKRKYKPVARRGKEDGGKKIEVTERMFTDAMNMINSVMSTDAYKELDGFERQAILTMDIGKSKYFDPKFAGMLDFLHVDKDTNSAIIVDLKTSRTVDPKKYSYHARDLGYWLQASAYVSLVNANYAIPTENIQFFHLVVEKDMKGIHKVDTFLFNGKAIEAYIHNVFWPLINKVVEKTEFNKANCTFHSAIELQDVDSVYAEVADEEEWV